jgi:hypothetical protein
VRGIVALLALLITAPLAAAAPNETPAALTGTWLATADDGRVFAGTWSAAVAVATPNAAIGSWKLVDETGSKVLMSGTWAARKTGGQWKGAWSAKVAGGGDAAGKWTADASVNGAKTFGEMLALALQKPISGTWKAGRASGHWWLKPTPPRP